MEIGLEYVHGYHKNEESNVYIAEADGSLNNERYYKQKGLFLSPFNMGHHPSSIFTDSKGRPITRFEKNLPDTLGFGNKEIAEYVEINEMLLSRVWDRSLPADEYALVKLVLSPSIYSDARALLIADPDDLIDDAHLGFYKKGITNCRGARPSVV